MRSGRLVLVGLLAVSTACAATPASPRGNAARATSAATQPSPPPSGASPNEPPRPPGKRFPPCDAAQLRGSAGDSNGLTGGTAVVYLTLRNVSDRDCSLTGAPVVTAYDMSGRRLQLRPVQLDGDFPAHLRPVALLAHPRYADWSEARVPISVTGLTDAGAPCPDDGIRPIGRFAIALGAAGVVAAPVSRRERVGTCEGRIRTGSFLPANGA